MKKWIDRIARQIFTLSGFVTSVVILLIIGFLFSEGAGLFRQPIVEEGYVLALNKSNDVERLSAEQIKQLFDEDITNWKEVGGSDMPVTVFRLEDLDRLYSETELGSEYEHAGEKIAEQVRKCSSKASTTSTSFLTIPSLSRMCFLVLNGSRLRHPLPSSGSSLC